MSNDSAVLAMPNEDESLERRMPWFMVSNAAERSSRIRAEICLRLIARFKSFCTPIGNVSVKEMRQGVYTGEHR